LFTNLLHRGPLKTTSGAACGPRVGQPCFTCLCAWASGGIFPGGALVDFSKRYSTRAQK